MYRVDYSRAVPFGTFDSFPSRFFNAISTRAGGFSDAPFDSLNLGLHVGDNPERVIQNRKVFIESISKFKLDDLVTPEQIHGDRVEIVTQDHRGRGSREYSDSISKTDALTTQVKDLPLMLCFADCVPVLFCDPIHDAVGIAHAGFKGTQLEIARKTLHVMEEDFATDPSECLIAIAPSIGGCCYTRDGKSIDLWKMNREQLISSGVLESHIDSSNVCTRCNSAEYFSYRASGGKTGRIAAIIAILGGD